MLRLFPAVHRNATTTGSRARRAARLLCTAGGVALAVSMVAMSGTAQAATGDAHLAGLHYVALGDSYAAGLGLPPLATAAVPGCGQGTNNYPQQVAAELGLALTDVTCAGATTANLIATAQTVPGGTNPVQDASLSSTTDIVTVTIGGNDLGFTDVMKSCAALSAASGPVLGDPLNNPLTLPNCDALYAPVGMVGVLSAKIATDVASGLQAVLTDIAAKAPQAKVFVVGYPALTPGVIPVGGCFTAVSPTLAAPFTANAYPYTDVDVPYLHTVETNLNTAIGTVATTNGATFVPLLAETATHSPCASATPYVNGVNVNSLSLAPVLAVDLNVDSLHPNAAGVSYTTEQLLAAIRAAFPAPPAPADNSTDTSTDTSAAPAAILPVTGAEPSGWLVGVAILLLLAGGITLGFDRRSAAVRR